MEKERWVATIGAIGIGLLCIGYLIGCISNPWGQSAVTLCGCVVVICLMGLVNELM